MKILGVSFDVWLASAALIEDGKVVAAGAEERFNRQKMYKWFPLNAVKYCLKESGLTIGDIDYVAVGWNPVLHMKPLNFRFSGISRWRGEQLHSIPNYIIAMLEDKNVYAEMSFRDRDHGLSGPKVIYVAHHLAHAANAFFLSPYSEAAILTVDGRGEEDTTLFALGTPENKVQEIKTIKFPHSIGLLYSTFTQFLGFSPDMDEWKVMALAAYGKKNNRYYKKLKQLVKLNSDGTFELDLSYFSYYLHDQEFFYTEKFRKTFGNSRNYEDGITERHYELASALQQVTEEVLAHMLKWLYKETGIKNLAVGGGLFMNSVFNGKILQMTPFENVFVSSCPDDSGVSLGAGLYVYDHILNGNNRNEQTDNYYGPAFSNDEIREVLAKYKLFALFFEDIEGYAAKMISDGKIIGWFQGRMEFGQRALGNRSILADPRRPEMKDKVNAVIKYREFFRPFAPTVLEEYAAEYFDCPEGSQAPFMEKVFMIKKDKQEIIPAVTHVDGSGRLQTLNKRTNGRYYKLVEAFYGITGVPVILNTSFNLKGEPIVCTPTDAIRTFYSCGLDVLVLGKYVINK